MLREQLWALFRPDDWDNDSDAVVYAWLSDGLAYVGFARRSLTASGVTGYPHADGLNIPPNATSSIVTPQFLPNFAMLTGSQCTVEDS